ncbi:MAG: rhomboid family intramembrane serine protease [Thermodesulfobacteriota bacterium]
MNTALIILNAAVFLYEFTLGENMITFIFRYGFIPAKVFSASSNITITERLYPFVTSMFLHGGWLHLIGNMLFLYIFGDNVEGRMGHFKYIIFYIVCGLAAASFQFITYTQSVIPMIGASGAISGVLGAYITFYPRSKILTLVPIFFLIQLVNIPASLFIIYWFLIQFLSGLSTLNLHRETGGVAFWAHIGGFVAGLMLARFFDRG